jgi:hypothetical protein
MNNNENMNWREIVAGFSSYEGTLGNFCNANHITKSQYILSIFPNLPTISKNYNSDAIIYYYVLN